MINAVKDYFKCAVANRILLLGYVSVGAYVLGKTIEHSCDLPSTEWSDTLVGCVMQLTTTLTSCGLETFRQYRKTKKFISENGTVLGAPKKKYDETLWYCNRTGIRLAAREEGLEHLLKE